MPRVGKTLRTVLLSLQNKTFLELQISFLIIRLYCYCDHDENDYDGCENNKLGDQSIAGYEPIIRDI